MRRLLAPLALAQFTYVVSMVVLAGFAIAGFAAAIFLPARSRVAA